MNSLFFAQWFITLLKHSLKSRFPSVNKIELHLPNDSSLKPLTAKMNHLTIRLINVHFFAFHGLYPEERQNGNHFLLDIAIEYTPNDRVNSIEQTIDYVTVFQIAKARMDIPTPLLETVVMDICEEIFLQFQAVDAVSIHLSKQNPPIEQFQGHVGVQYNKKRN